MRFHPRHRLAASLGASLLILGCASPAMQPTPDRVSMEAPVPGVTVAAATLGGPRAEAGAACASADWSEGRPYRAGNVVAYEGNMYIAKEDNPGYNPTISTYYWAPHRC